MIGNSAAAGEDMYVCILKSKDSRGSGLSFPHLLKTSVAAAALQQCAIMVCNVQRILCPSLGQKL